MYGLPLFEQWQTVFVFLTIVVAFLVITVLRKNNKALIAVVLLLLISNYVVFKQYYYARSNFNASGYFVFRTTGQLMQELDSMGEIKSREDIQRVKRYLSSLYSSMQALDIYLRCPGFSSDSIDRGKLRLLVCRLDSIVDRSYTVAEQEDLEFNNTVKSKIAQIGRLVDRAVKGLRSEGVFGISKIVIVFEHDDLQQFEALLGELEDMLEIK